jgi:hypothetical protein
MPEYRRLGADAYHVDTLQRCVDEIVFVSRQICTACNHRRHSRSPTAYNHGFCRRGGKAN